MQVDYNKIHAAYIEGLNDREIAELTGYSADSVFHWRKREQHPPNGKINDNKCRELYKCGMTDIEIANELKCNVVTVRRWRTKHGYVNNCKKEDDVTKICRFLRTRREYGRNNMVHKSKNISVDRGDDGRSISCRCEISYNLVTGNIVIVSGLQYHRKYIGLDNCPSKYNCHTDVAANMYTGVRIRRKQQYSPDKRRKYYLKDKMRVN